MNHTKQAHDAIWQKSQEFKAQSNSMLDFVVMQEVEKKGAANVHELVAKLKNRIAINDFKTKLSPIFAVNGDSITLA